MPSSVHVALLRGINVGGKNKVEMPRLRAVFEAAGMQQVSTYINTGNVMFLWNDVDRPEVLDGLDWREDIDDVRYIPGALLWRVDRPNLTRSRITKMVGTKLYRSMTVRNVNTVRKLTALMDDTAD